MMWAAILYAVFGSWAAHKIGRPLAPINFALERYNADFRYRMVRIRENAESIALYRGEVDEERRLRGAFASIYATWWDFMKYTKRLDVADVVLRAGRRRVPLPGRGTGLFLRPDPVGHPDPDGRCLRASADGAVLVRRQLSRVLRA